MIRLRLPVSRYSLLIALWVAALALPIHGQDDPPVLLVLGDSLSAAYGIAPAKGWVALLQGRLNASYPRLRVVNISITGDTSRGGLARLPAALERYRPRVVLIELGANDGLRGIPAGEIRQNLETLVRTATAHGAEVLLIGIRLPLNYGHSFRKAFEAVYTQVAHTQGVPLLESLLEPVEQHPDLFQEDGVHPGVAAQALILDHVWTALEPMLKGLARTPQRGPTATTVREALTAPRPSP